MDKAYRGLLKYRQRAIKILVKRYGVRVQIFRPLKINSFYASNDETMEYENTPYFEGKVLIPSMLKIQQNNISYFDSIFDADDNNFLYSNIDTLDNFSKIVVIKDGNNGDDEIYQDPQPLKHSDPLSNPLDRNLISDDSRLEPITMFKIENTEIYDANFDEIFKKYGIIPYYSIEDTQRTNAQEDTPKFTLDELGETQEETEQDSYYIPIT